MNRDKLSRRDLLALAAASACPAALRAQSTKHVSVGLLIYAVLADWKKDFDGTLKAVAQMGYQGVEFYAPYFEWTEAQTKQMRQLLDSLGIRCFSTHNDSDYFSGDKLTSISTR